MPLYLLTYFTCLLTYLLTYLLTHFFQREFREICISFGWQRNGTFATAGDAGEAGDIITADGDGGNGEAEPVFMGVNIEGFSGVATACLNAGFIVVFNALYRVVAVQLTAWENHRTEYAYENELEP